MGGLQIYKETMADRNDFKLLKQRCLRHFELAKYSFDSVSTKLDDNQKARYGFYFFVIQNLTNIVDYDKIIESITDTDFNSTFFNNKETDEGIDAVCIDEQTHQVALFNFKYRDKYNVDKEQSKNELLTTSKFLSALKQESIKHLKGKLKTFAEQIILNNNSDEIWNTVLYYVSNENKTLVVHDPNIKHLCDEYGIAIETMGLNELVDITSLHPKNIDATLILNRDAVMSFTESSLASSKSYIVRLPLTELIRITCDNAELRGKYNLENDDILYDTNVDIRVLFDNVRGFILQSKYNKNIESTLETEPSKFFFFNNGITIVADNISSTEINSGKKVKLEISNFQVLNGGQTLRTVHNFNKKNKQNIVEKLSNAEVLVRLLNITDDALKGRIGEYTNSQNSINERDLKSLRPEQVKLEEFLSSNKILYIRKKGDVGQVDMEYDYSVSMELLGQILWAANGFPEMVSNKKREIFSIQYDNLFANNIELLSNNTVELIRKYRNIYKEYKSVNRTVTVQKAMYVLYISKNLNRSDYRYLSEKFESFLKAYKKTNNIEKAESRVLLDIKFKNEVEKHFGVCSN